MNGVAFRAKADVRRRWRGWLVLGLVIGGFAGLLIAAAGGARRIASAYDRFSTATRAADVVVVPGCRRMSPDVRCVEYVDLSGLGALDEVAELSVVYGGRAPVTTVDGTVLNTNGDPCWGGSGSFLILGPMEARLGAPFNGVVLAAGRLPRPDRADEVTLAVAPAQRADVGVGDEILLYLTASGCEKFMWGVPTRVRVVGIGQMPGEVAGSRGIRLETVHANAALFADLLSDTTPAERDGLTFVRLAIGVSADEFYAAASAAGMPISKIQEADAVRAGVEHRLAPDSMVLWVVALVGGAAAVVVLGSAIARVGAAGAGDSSALRCLGWRRREFVACGAAEGAAIGLVAALCATTVAYLASDVVTVGDSRQIDPERGLQVDGWPIVVGAAITVVVVACAFASGRLGAARGALDDRSAARRRWSDGLLSRIPGAPVAATTGIRFAIAPAARNAVPFWRGGTGLTCGVFGVVAALTFLAGVDHLATTPRLFGVSWDAIVGLPEGSTPAATDDALERLRQDPRVRAVSTGTYFLSDWPPREITVGSIVVVPMSFSTGPKAIEPTVIEGRAPQGPDEILFNPLLSDRLGLRLGAEVDIRVTTAEGQLVDTLLYELVGTGVVPVLDGRTEIGTAMTLDGLRRLSPDTVAAGLFVDLDDDATAETVLSEYEIEPPDSLAGLSLEVEQLLGIDVDRIRQAPIVLATALGAMATGVLAHLALSAVRARTREIAVIRALGFDSRQVRRAMGWMVTLLVGVSLTAAVPLGVFAGRAAFVVYAERLGVAPDPVVPVWTIAGVLAASLLVGYFVSLWPSWRASRVTTATVLRAE